MDVAAKSRFALVFLMLTFCLGVSFPAEDIPETRYDESESVPYEVTPLFSVAVLPVASRTAQAPLSSSPKTAAKIPVCSGRVHDINANRFTIHEPQLVLLCTRLC